MSKRNSTLTQERLRQLVFYDKKTGVFTRKTALPGRYEAGDVAGTNDGNGYIRMMVGGIRASAHRLAWLYVKGEWPLEIDHRNGVGTDNKWRNLRNGTHQFNVQNRRTAHRDNKSTGLLGAHGAANGKFTSSIAINGRAIRLGTFTSARAAHAAYVKAKRALHASCTI